MVGAEPLQVVPLADGVISHMLRPCVATRSFSLGVPGWTIFMSKTAAAGRPVPNGAHVAPPSVDAKTPMSVPANRCVESFGSTRNAFTGMLGIPFAAAVHTGVAAERFVVFQTPWPAGA